MLVPLSLAVSAFVTNLSAQGAGAQAGADATETRLQEIRTEFTQISNKLNAIQGEALQDPEVAEKQKTYNKTLKQEMVKIAPKEEEPKVEKCFDLEKQLDNLSSPQSMEERQKAAELSQDYQQLKQELASIENEATQIAEVQEKRTTFLTAITEKMGELEPNFGKLIDRQQELVEEYRTIQQEIGG